MKYYKELELYIISSTVIIEQLKDVFFHTGEDPHAKFVKLIYNFKGRETWKNFFCKVYLCIYYIMKVSTLNNILYHDLIAK